MPIQIQDLRTSFVEASLTEPMASILRRLPPDRGTRTAYYVVAPVGGGRYLVARWVEIETQTLTFDPSARAGLNLTQLSQLPGPVDSVEQNSMGIKTARDLAQSQPGRRLVVTSGGAVVGVVELQALISPGPVDPFAGIDLSPAVSVLGPEEEPLTGAGPLEGLAEPAADDRVFNAWIGDREADEPLQLGETYELKFNVDRPRAGTQTALFDASKAFQGLPPDVQTVEITVALDSEDFDIIGDDQRTLIVPRAGKSKNTASFTIEPKQNGVGTLNAVFISRNRIIQKMTIRLQVGSAARGAPVMTAVTRGVMFATALLPERPNTVNLVIEQRDAGYRVRLFNGVSVPPANLNLSETYIAELILRARDTLKNLVYLRTPANQYAYQSADTNIPADIHRESLQTLARLGYYLYQKIFFAPGNGLEAQNLGKQLRLYSQQKKLNITIVAERFIFPWALLYDRDPVDLENVDPEGFWGFKHIVEYRPEFSNPSPVSFFPEINCDDKLNLAFICNTAIDDELTRKGFGAVVKPQSDYLRTLPDLNVTEYPTRQALVNLLNATDSPEQILYFYCHAVSNLPGEAGGVAGSKFVLTDSSITIADLDFDAPIGADKMLKQAPLVFLNACQSAELSPFLYDGLIPYLVGKGIRGVVGTEVDTPALFAAEFAKEFIRRFTAGGVTLGNLLLEMRRDYLLKKNNVMGLLYALYSSGEISVKRAAR